MKKIATVCLLFIGQLSFAQIQIVSADLPQSGDVLYQENATWTGNWDLEESGASLIWNVGSTNVTLLGSTTTTDCMPMSGAPVAYQFFFGSPFDSHSFRLEEIITHSPI